MMKKIIPIIAVAVLLVFAQQGHAQMLAGTKGPTDAFTTVTLAGFTCNLSTVSGTAFITNPSVDISKYARRKINLTAGGKTLVGYIKAAGTGEMLGSDLLNGWNFTSGWSKAVGTETIDDANSFTTTDPGGSGLYKSVVTAGRLYYFEGAGTTSAVALTFHIFKNGSALSPILNGSYRTAYLTSGGATDFYCRAQGGGTTDIASLLLKQVLTPSADGVTIVSAKGGTTHNWASDDGIDPNAASFTAVISED